MVVISTREALAALLIFSSMPVLAQTPAAGQSSVGELLQRGGIQPTQGNLQPTDEKQTFIVIDKLENQVPLPQDLKDLKDRMPPDPDSIVRTLGLPDRKPVKTDLRDTPTPSVEQIRRALQNR